MNSYAKKLGEVLRKFDTDALTEFVLTSKEIDKGFAAWWLTINQKTRELTLIKMIEMRTDLKDDEELKLKIKKWKEENNYEN